MDIRAHNDVCLAATAVEKHEKRSVRHGNYFTHRYPRPVHTGSVHGTAGLLVLEKEQAVLHVLFHFFTSHYKASFSNETHLVAPPM